MFTRIMNNMVKRKTAVVATIKILRIPMPNALWFSSDFQPTRRRWNSELQIGQRHLWFAFRIRFWVNNTSQNMGPAQRSFGIFTSLWEERWCTIYKEASSHFAKYVDSQVFFIVSILSNDGLFAQFKIVFFEQRNAPIHTGLKWLKNATI